MKQRSTNGTDDMRSQCSTRSMLELDIEYHQNLDCYITQQVFTVCMQNGISKPSVDIPLMLNCPYKV